MDLFRRTVMGEPGGPNRAITARSLLLRERPFRSALADLPRSVPSVRGPARTWVSRRNGRIIGLASAGERAGPHSWEVSRLSVSNGDDDCLPDLLAKAAQTAASAGAVRVFMRLRRDDDLVETARSAGFYASFSELLYKGSPSQSTSGPRAGVLPSLRKAEPRDDYNLFRLYTAATPPEVRTTVGMGFDHWTSSRERHRGQRRNLVMVEDEAVRGSVSTTRSSGTGQLEVTVHPDHERSLGAMVDFGLESLTRARAVLCLVPEYQIALKRVLAERGFEPVSEYVMLVKSMARTVKDQASAKATATST